ncbi:MAG TPA: CvpA family protein [Kiritimatiellia bacterium]|jgi:uncharacterized membrane protein
MFNVVDAAIAVVVLVGVLGGIRRGLSGELARLIAAGVALYVAWKFAEPLADWLMQKQPMSYTRGYAMAFIGITAAALALTFVLRIMLRSVMEFAFRGRIERIGGALCALVRSGIVVAFVVLLVSLAPEGELRAAVCDESFVGSAVCRRLRPMYDDLRQLQPELPLPAPAVEGENTNDFVVTDVEETETTNEHE